MSRLLRCMPPGIRTLLGDPIRFPASYVFLDVEKLVEARLLQGGGPSVFRFPYDPVVGLLEAVYCVCPVFFVHRVPHAYHFLEEFFILKLIFFVSFSTF